MPSGDPSDSHGRGSSQTGESNRGGGGGYGGGGGGGRIGVAENDPFVYTRERYRINPITGRRETPAPDLGGNTQAVSPSPQAVVQSKIDLRHTYQDILNYINENNININSLTMDQRKAIEQLKIEEMKNEGKWDLKAQTRYYAERLVPELFGFMVRTPATAMVGAVTKEPISAMLAGAYVSRQAKAFARDAFTSYSLDRDLLSAQGLDEGAIESRLSAKYSAKDTTVGGYGSGRQADMVGEAAPSPMMRTAAPTQAETPVGDPFADRLAAIKRNEPLISRRQKFVQSPYTRDASRLADIRSQYGLR